MGRICIFNSWAAFRFAAYHIKFGESVIMQNLLDKPVSLTPEEFEREVQSLLNEMGGGLSEFKVTRREKISGVDGVYEIDVAVRFEALGADFLVLVECKHHEYPIKREVIQVLHDRLRSISAQKGMLFATVRFQRGAIEYAKKHRITLVQIADGKTSYLVKAEHRERDLPSWIPYVSWMVTISEEGRESYSLVRKGSLQALSESLGKSKAI
jgi:restriction system protein